MSLNKPPDTFKISIGGGAGSKEVIDKSSALPISPASRALFKAAKFGSNLRLNPNIIGWPLGFVFSRHCLARSKLISTGFSHKTALPANVAFSIISEWVSVELATRTASIDLSL